MGTGFSHERNLPIDTTRENRTEPAMIVDQFKGIGYSSEVRSSGVSLRGNRSTAASADTNSVTRSGDELVLSREARFFRSARELLATLPEPTIRQAMVQALREKIENGEYPSVDSTQVAEKLMEAVALPAHP
jgi:flagellar biosynthesis anti-sigma factor FlgM